MTIIVTILFPIDANINVDHYVNVHLPLAAKIYGTNGLRSMKIIEYKQSPFGPQKYRMGGQMVWDSLEIFQERFFSEARQPLDDDTPNYSDKLPDVFLIGEELASHGEVEALQAPT